MSDTATPETGPVDAPATMDSVLAEFEADNETADALESVTQELVNEAEGTGDAEQAPQAEDDATEAATEATEAEEGTPDEQTFTVKVNGEERQVPLNELLNGYSRTEDYKAKTAAVAEEKRAVAAERQQIEARVFAEHASQLEEATSLFAQFDPVLAQVRTLDWEALKQSDPGAYLQAQDAVSERLNAIQQMKAKVEWLRGEAAKKQDEITKRERSERFERAEAEIVKARPDLADQAKFTDFAKGTVEYLRSEGFNGDEIAEVLDHRVLTLADKARQWDAHVKARQALPEKKIVPKSAVKPLTTDGGSRAPQSRFPANASRDRKVDWAVQQILSES